VSGKHTALAAALSPLIVALVLSGAAAGGRSHDRVPPSAPTNPRVTSAAPHSVSLVWDASTDNMAVAGYYLYVNQHRVKLTS
jgi:chitinase